MEESWYQKISEAFKQFGEWTYNKTHCPICNEITLIREYCVHNKIEICKKCILAAQQKDYTRRCKEYDEKVKVQCATCKVSYKVQKLTRNNDSLYYCGWCITRDKYCYFCDKSLGCLTYNNTLHVERRGSVLPVCDYHYKTQPSW